MQTLKQQRINAFKNMLSTFCNPNATMTKTMLTSTNQSATTTKPMLTSTNQNAMMTKTMLM
jgi:hypothetical protein